MSVVVKSDNRSIDNYIADVTQRAAFASREIASASTDVKNQALLYIAEQILSSNKKLKQQNAHDLEQGKTRGLDDAL